MALMNIVLYPDDPLTKKARDVEQFDGALKSFVADMFETMEANDGVGLAAPQVGVSRRLLVLREPETGRELCLINPEIVEKEGCEYGEEGCLSVPNIYAAVPRYTRIRVRALDEHGAPLDIAAANMLARIIQHEMDHLEGIVFPDRLDILTRQAKLDEWRDVRAHMAEAVAEL